MTVLSAIEVISRERTLAAGLVRWAHPHRRMSATRHGILAQAYATPKCFGHAGTGTRTQKGATPGGF